MSRISVSNSLESFIVAVDVELGVRGDGKKGALKRGAWGRERLLSRISFAGLLEDGVKNRFRYPKAFRPHVVQW